MVDVVVNNVMATSLTPDYSKYMFKDAVRFPAAHNVNSHLICSIGALSHLLPGGLEQYHQRAELLAR